MGYGQLWALQVSNPCEETDDAKDPCFILHSSTDHIMDLINFISVEITDFVHAII
jgi:hypothetical protein